VQGHEFRDVLHELGDGADKGRGMGEASQYVVYDDTNFKIGLRLAAANWTDGAKAIGTALADSGAVEGIVRDADIVDDRVACDVAEGVGGRNAAGRAGDDDTQGSGHAQVGTGARTWNGIAGVDPSVGGFEIENGGKGRGGYGAQGLPEVEGDADDGHKTRIEDGSEGGSPPGILGKAEQVRKDSISAGDTLGKLAIKRVSVVDIDALAISCIEQAAALFGLPFIMRFEKR